MIRENAELLFKTKRQNQAVFFLNIRNITRNVIHEINARIINFPKLISLSLKNDKQNKKRKNKIK